MSIVAWPTAARVKRIEWTPPAPAAQVNRSEWTSKRQVTILALTSRWAAKVEIVPIIGQDASLAWQAFLVDLEGVVNRFRIPAVEAPQFNVAMPLQVNGAGQQGYALAVRNGAAGKLLRRGHKLTVNDQMIMVMADTLLDGNGSATVPIKPFLRSAPANGAAIEAINPTCMVTLTSGNPGGWSVDPGQLYGISFEVQEP